MKPAFFTGLLMLLLGSVLAGLALFAVPYCRTEVPMPCFWTVRAVSCIGAAVAIAGVVMQFVERGVAMGLQIANILFGVLAMLFSTIVIGLCPDAMMECRTKGDGILLVAGAVVSLAALLDLWRLSRRN